MIDAVHQQVSSVALGTDGGPEIRGTVNIMNGPMDFTFQQRESHWKS